MREASPHLSPLPHSLFLKSSLYKPQTLSHLQAQPCPIHCPGLKEVASVLLPEASPLGRLCAITLQVWDCSVTAETCGCALTRGQVSCK